MRIFMHVMGGGSMRLTDAMTIQGARGLQAICRVIVVLLISAATSVGSARAQETADPSVDSVPSELAMVDEVEQSERWEYFVPVVLPERVQRDEASSEPELVEVELGPAVFSHARADLADLRILDSRGRNVPYALRYLYAKSIQDRVLATEFDRSETVAGPTELTLDLQRDDIEHNEIRITTDGVDFRRVALVEASDDRQHWRNLAKAELLHYRRHDGSISLDSLTYPPSRARYLRVRVEPDSLRVDEFRVMEVRVLRHVEIPERLRIEAVDFGKREPVRRYGVPGSSWTIDLGGDQVPCSQIEVDVADREFARDVSFEIDMLDVTWGRRTFLPVFPSMDPTWQRRPGEKIQPMVTKFTEFQTRRLRIFVADHRNPPLTIQAVRFGAAVRQLLFVPPEGPRELRIAFGNPAASMPNYDFARNLPAVLPGPIRRAQLLEVQKNPDFQLPPQPFTERFPWLIYVVLAAVCVVLTALIVNLSRAAIAIHDERLEVTTS